MKKIRVKKPTKYDLLIIATAQDYAHESSKDIFRRRDVLNHEREVLEMKISDLQIALVNAKEQRAGLTAVLTGLQLVIEKR